MRNWKTRYITIAALIVFSGTMAACSSDQNSSAASSKQEETAGESQTDLSSQTGTEKETESTTEETTKKEAQLTDGQSVIRLKEDGTLQYEIREAFGDASYELGDLKELAKEEVKEFNENFASTDKGMKLEEVSREQDSVVLEYTFASGNDLYQYLFNYEQPGENFTFYCGPAVQADSTYWDLSGKLKVVSGKKPKGLTLEKALQDESLGVLVTNKPCYLELEQQICYVSQNASYEEGLVTTGQDGLSYIFYIK